MVYRQSRQNRRWSSRYVDQIQARQTWGDDAEHFVRISQVELSILGQLRYCEGPSRIDCAGQKSLNTHMELDNYVDALHDLGLS
jgi:hypothetical protein